MQAESILVTAASYWDIYCLSDCIWIAMLTFNTIMSLCSLNWHLQYIYSIKCQTTTKGLANKDSVPLNCSLRVFIRNVMDGPIGWAEGTTSIILACADGESIDVVFPDSQLVLDFSASKVGNKDLLNDESTYHWQKILAAFASSPIAYALVSPLFSLIFNVRFVEG